MQGLAVLARGETTHQFTVPRAAHGPRFNGVTGPGEAMTRRMQTARRRTDPADDYLPVPRRKTRHAPWEVAREEGVLRGRGDSFERHSLEFSRPSRKPAVHAYVLPGCFWHQRPGGGGRQREHQQYPAGLHAGHCAARRGRTATNTSSAVIPKAMVPTASCIHEASAKGSSLASR